MTVYIFSQRLLLLLQDKDKEVEELLQEIQCEKVPCPALAPFDEPIEPSGYAVVGPVLAPYHLLPSSAN